MAVLMVLITGSDRSMYLSSEQTSSGSGEEGVMPPPDPVKISHIKMAAFRIDFMFLGPPSPLPGRWIHHYKRQFVRFHLHHHDLQKNHKVAV